MKYSILALGNHESLTTLTQKIRATLNSYGSDIDVEFANTDKNAVERAKCANAILLPRTDKALPSAMQMLVKMICQNCNLHSVSTKYKDKNGTYDITLVQDSIGGMLNGENGFRTNPSSGREAYAVHSYSELDIEKTARIAYELAKNSRKKITLADLDPHLATSNLWYKILTDINEDYPSTSVGCSQMRFVVQDMVSAPQDLDIVLSDSLTGKMLSCVANSTLDADMFSCYIGDTPLALYTYTKSISQDGIDALAKHILTTSLGGMA